MRLHPCMPNGHAHHRVCSVFRGGQGGWRGLCWKVLMEDTKAEGWVGGWVRWGGGAAGACPPSWLALMGGRRQLQPATALLPGAMWNDGR